MPTRKPKASEKVLEDTHGKEKVQPRCLAISEAHIRTSHDLKNFTAALISDLVAGRITPNIGNATCNATGKLLKTVELEYKYGTDGPDTGLQRALLLTA